MSRSAHPVLAFGPTNVKVRAGPLPGKERYTKFNDALADSRRHIRARRSSVYRCSNRRREDGAATSEVSATCRLPRGTATNTLTQKSYKALQQALQSAGSVRTEAYRRSVRTFGVICLAC